MLIVIPAQSKENNSEKYIVKEMKRELKWYATKQLFNTQKKAAMEGARNERDVRCVKKKKVKWQAQNLPHW